MEREEEILKRYKQTNFSGRICLFLHYRDLRDAFQVIGFKDSAAKRELSPLAEIPIKRKGDIHEHIYL
jgi:hypothetical protein